MSRAESCWQLGALNDTTIMLLAMHHSAFWYCPPQGIPAQ